MIRVEAKWLTPVELEFIKALTSLVATNAGVQIELVGEKPKPRVVQEDEGDPEPPAPMDPHDAVNAFDPYKAMDAWDSRKKR